MVAERARDVERRAAVHAALGDPARLQIVDALSLGDVSPSELTAMLDMSSNLVAHHLNVLEATGLIERRRSEGDHRRTYLRLVGPVLDDLAVPLVGPLRRVLFVCTANTARSQLAAALWRRSSSIPAVSAGTHPADRIAAGALAAAKRHGLSLPNIRPRAIDDVRADGDFVITVCDLAHEDLGAAGDLHWSVPDPVPAGKVRAFDQALADLHTRVAHLAPRLAAS